MIPRRDFTPTRHQQRGKIRNSVRAWPSKETFWIHIGLFCQFYEKGSRFVYFTFYHRTVGVGSHAHIADNMHEQLGSTANSHSHLESMSSSPNGPCWLRSTDAVEECNSTPAKLDADRRPASAPIVQMRREVRPAMTWLKTHHQATACKPCAIRCSVCSYCWWLFVGGSHDAADLLQSLLEGGVRCSGPSPSLWTSSAGTERSGAAHR